MPDHAERLAALRAALPAAVGGGAPLGLAKRTSNLFRDRDAAARARLALSAFSHVLAVDAARGWVDVEALATYEALVDATPFRHGLVHDTMQELDVLLADGRVVHCTPDNEHAALFFGFPNSYGTLGYALRLRLGTKIGRASCRE